MRWLLTAAALGELAVLMDLGSRVFGSYRRWCTGAVWRVGLMVCCCVVPAMPALLIHAGVDTAFVRRAPSPSVRVRLDVRGRAGRTHSVPYRAYACQRL